MVMTLACSIDFLAQTNGVSHLLDTGLVSFSPRLSGNGTCAKLRCQLGGAVASEDHGSDDEPEDTGSVW